MYNKQNLTRLKQMNELVPEVMKAFWTFDKAAVAEGAIPVKYKELIAEAVALLFSHSLLWLRIISLGAARSSSGRAFSSADVLPGARCDNGPCLTAPLPSARKPWFVSAAAELTPASPASARVSRNRKRSPWAGPWIGWMDAVGLTRASTLKRRAWGLDIRRGSFPLFRMMRLW